MPSLATFIRTLYAASLISPVATTPTSEQRPIYAVAQRVFNPKAIETALAHGANAFQVDLFPWYFGWWADDDGSFTSTGSSACELFEYIADQRLNGKNVSFVRLDIRTPDLCKERRACSIEALQDLAREILQPAGVRVLYGFPQPSKSRGYGVITSFLNTNEAVALSGRTYNVLEWYKLSDKTISVERRVMDYGDSRLGRAPNLYAELHYGSWSRDQGKLGKVFGWASADGGNGVVTRLLGEAAVDGVICSRQDTTYGDRDGCKDVMRDIINFVNSHPDTHRMATNNDYMW